MAPPPTRGLAIGLDPPWENADVRDIVVRRARLSDTAEMRAMTRNVWGGTDYVPFVWEQWLRDPRGYVMAAAGSGRLLGLQHIGLQPDGAAWVEGIRVADDAQGEGIGTLLLGHAIQWARRNGCTAIRLSTYRGNPASNRIAAKTGLTVAATFLPAEAPALSGAVSDAAVSVAPATAFDEIISSLRDSSTSAPFYTEGWTAYRLTDGRLRLLLATGAVIRTGSAEIEGIAIVTSTRNRPSLKLGLLQGTEDGMVRLVDWVRRHAGDAGLLTVRAMIAETRESENLLARSGFSRHPGALMYVHELNLQPDGITAGIRSEAS